MISCSDCYCEVKEEKKSDNSLWQPEGIGALDKGSFKALEGVEAQSEFTSSPVSSSRRKETSALGEGFDGLILSYLESLYQEGEVV